MFTISSENVIEFKLSVYFSLLFLYLNLEYFTS